MYLTTLSRTLTIVLLPISFLCQAQIVEDIVIVNNETTKDWIISRELVINKGDSINESIANKLKRSEENLYNTSLFNDVRVIDTVIDNKNVVYVYVTERWYFWPYPILEHADRNLATYIHSEEWERINYGVMVIKHNFRGRREEISFKIRFGFRQQFGLNYYIPMVNKKTQKLGLYFDASLFRQKSFFYDIDNQRYLFHDLEDYGYKENRLIGGIVYRPKHNITHTTLATLNTFYLNDTIANISLPLFGSDNVSNKWYCFDYSFKYSTLNYIYYPTAGQELLLSLSAGTDYNNTWENIMFKYQTHLPIDYYITYSSIYLGEHFFSKIPPVGLRRSIGNNYYFRGYEDNVWKAQSSLGCRQQLSWNFFKKRSFQIQKISSKKFNKPFISVFATIFTDIGYVSKMQPGKTNSLIGSFGGGIDFVSYYDLIFRFEYVLNFDKKHIFNIHLGTAF